MTDSRLAGRDVLRTSDLDRSRLGQNQAFGQLPEQMLEWVAWRQMQEDAVVVLLDLNRDLE